MLYIQIQIQPEAILSSTNTNLLGLKGQPGFTHARGL